MAYLRHFKAFLAVKVAQPWLGIKCLASLCPAPAGLWLGLLAILVTLSGANAQFEPKTNPFDLSDLREAGKSAPLSKNLKKPRQVLENYYSKKLSALGIYLRPGTEHREDSKATPTSSRRCRSIVYQTLLKLPKEHRKQIKDLTLFYTKDGRRGLSGNGSVVLRCLNITENELASVLVHEIGHLVDSGYLAGSPNGAFSGFNDFDIPVSTDDASSIFYKITWNSESKKSTKTSEVDFVSLYAMTDPFEDFAETYTYYRLHGPEFRKLMQTSERLRKKYEFMKWYVFSGEEFGEFVDREDLNIWVRHYDVTVLPVS